MAWQGKAQVGPRAHGRGATDMEQLYLRENYQNSCSLNPFMQLKLITGFYEFGWNLIKSDLCTIMIKIYKRIGKIINYKKRYKNDSRFSVIFYL